MDALASPDILVFESFRLDPRRGCLLKQDQDGAYRPVAIGSRTLDVLSVLAERPGILLRRDEIMAAAWPGTVVEDNNLAVQISALRRILDRDRAEGSCIQTIPGRGYRFVASVTRLEIPAPPVGGSSDNGAEGALAEGWQPQRTVGPSGPRVTPINLPRNRKRGWGGLLTAVAGALSLSVAAVAASNWHFPWWTSPGSVPRLSMVVLPFANLSKDPDQQYFADGITEDLMTDLSRFANMLVISRNAAFSYRNKPVDEKQIGHDLRVRYVLEGSVQRLGDRVRVNAQLVDAETNRTLWADRFDSGMGDLPALQNEVTSRLANALTVGLITAEAARPIKDPDAVDYLLRGYAATSKR